MMPLRTNLNGIFVYKHRITKFANKTFTLRAISQQSLEGNIQMDKKAALDFIFEIGHLKRIKHEGWRYCGISSLESVADHTSRAAVIAFILAKLEKYPDPYKVCTMAVFHDIGECRIGDIHKVANRYIEANEEQAVTEQTANLAETGTEILSLWKQTDNCSSQAGTIAKDADLLEQAVSAKEYLEIGYTKAQGWMDSIRELLKTKSAQELLILLATSESNDWWKSLKKHE